MPTSHHTTISAASNPRVRHTDPKPRAPLTAAEQREKREARAERQDEIDTAVGEWFAYTYAKAEELAQRFKKNQRYFLDVFFQGGAHMIHYQEKVNPYNAFKSEKAAECREKGNPMRIDELHDNFHDEYLKLSDDEKAELIERFRDIKTRDVKLRRSTPRGRIQDLASTVRNMQLMMVGLGHRVGIEGFFCIVRNNADFHAKPHWYFTSPELENYMKIACRQCWDTVLIGTKIEAFAVAGSDVLNLLRTSKQKADFLKREVRDLVHEKLVEITGDAKAEMAYVQYEEKIVQNYGIKLVGWTAPRLVNPSELSSSLAPLQQLVHALKTEACKFVKLSPAERQERLDKYNEDIAAGNREPLQNHRCKDATEGKKRRRERAAKGGVIHNKDGEDGEDREDENDENGANSDPDQQAPPAKKRKTAPTARASGARGGKAAKSKPVAQRAPPARKAPAAKAASKSRGPRDDETTRKVITDRRARLRKSRAVITDSENEDDVPAPPPNVPAPAAMSAPIAGPISAPAGAPAAATAPAAPIIDPAAPASDPAAHSTVL